MPSGSCLPQLFLALPSYDSTFNLLEVPGLLFLLSSFERDIQVLKDSFSPLFFAVLSHLNPPCNPINKVKFSFCCCCSFGVFSLGDTGGLLLSCNTCTCFLGSASSFSAISFYCYTVFYAVLFQRLWLSFLWAFSLLQGC